MDAAVGVLGGTFNPVHVGHLRAAIECRDLLGLDTISLLPASLPPLKAIPGVDAEHRARMLDLAVAGIAGLEVDRRELEREGPSYTIDTLSELRAELGPERPMVFIMGADALANLHLWHSWQDLLNVAHIAVLARPLRALQAGPGVESWLHKHRVEPAQLTTRPFGCLAQLEQPTFDVSSTRLRQALQTGANVRFLLPEPVLEYIDSHGLYRSSKQSHRGCS